MQFFELMRRKNSVILRVCIRSPMSGMPARRQSAWLFMFLDVVLLIFAVWASVCIIVLVHALHLASVIPYAYSSPVSIFGTKYSVIVVASIAGSIFCAIAL